MGRFSSADVVGVCELGECDASVTLSYVRLGALLLHQYAVLCTGSIDTPASRLCVCVFVVLLSVSSSLKEGVVHRLSSMHSPVYQ
jgi:hypothetical protein